jgi:hypothetical protein
MGTSENTSLNLTDIAKDDPEKRQKFEMFKARNKTIIEMWMNTHPSQSHPPIYYDELKKEFRWLSRNERRAVKNIRTGKLIR